MTSVLRSVYSGTRTVQGVFKDLGRFREMAAILVRYGFGELLDRAPESLRIGPLKPDPEKLAQTLPQRVTGVLVELGPTFVKFGQIMSTRVDLLPPEFIDELKTLQDNVRPVSFAEVCTQLQTALGRPYTELFKSVEEVPLASASIAQVHAAITKDGRDVVIKVQRPAIQEKISGDLSLLAFLARQAEDIAPDIRMFNLVGMVEEFERSLGRETDFTVEASNMERFTRAFAGNPRVKIPLLHKDLSSATVLCMERIQGRKLTDAAKDGQLEATVRAYLDASYQMIFHDGFFHGDLHPGNALIQADGTLALLDFGMVGRLSGDMRDRLIDLVFAVLSEDMRNVARTFYSLGIPDRQLDYRACEMDVIDVMERHFVGRSMVDIQIGIFFRDMASVAMRHRVRLPTDYTMLFKALVTTEGLAKLIAPTINPVEAARPYIEAALADRYSMDRIKKQLLADAVDVSRIVRNLPGLAEHILQDLERGELTVRVDGGEKLQQSLDRMSRARDRATVGMVTSACLVSFAFMAWEARASLNLTLIASLLGLIGISGILLLTWSLLRRQ